MALGKVKQFTGHGSHLNITSMMDILVIILVFLLYNVSFEVLHLSIVNASVPTISTEDSKLEVEKQTVNMTLQLKTDGFKLSGGNEYLTDAEMQKLNSFIPNKAGKYDYSALSRFLVGVKQKYPKSRNMIIVPEDEVTYDTIVATMDASRDMPRKNKDEKKDADPLFPDVVVSSMVK